MKGMEEVLLLSSSSAIVVLKFSGIFSFNEALTLSTYERRIRGNSIF